MSDAPTKLGDVFADAEVARLYRYRAPYPDGVIEILRRLIVAPRIVLDAGAGSGAIARRLVPFAERVDAVDPSAAMIAAGRSLPAGADPRIRWLLGGAEDVELDGPYGLIACGASLHWMDLDVVLPRFRDTLAAGAVVAVVDTENGHWGYRDEVLDVVKEHSELELLGQARASTDSRLREVPDAALARPSLWGELEVSVRMRLHQIAAHLVEVTLQTEKMLGVDAPDNETRRILRRASAMRGLHERWSDARARAELDARYRRLARP